MEDTPVVFRCRKCGHSELRDGEAVQYCHIMTERRSLFSGETRTEMCGGIMEEECQSTDTSAKEDT